MFWLEIETEVKNPGLRGICISRCCAQNGNAALRRFNGALQPQLRERKTVKSASCRLDGNNLLRLTARIVYCC